MPKDGKFTDELLNTFFFFSEYDIDFTVTLHIQFSGFFFFLN